MKLQWFKSLAVVLISSALADESMKTTEQLLKDANALLASGQFGEALDSYSAAIERDPKNYMTYFKRATAYISLGRNRQALDDFTSILNIKPDFTKALFQRSKIYAKQGELDQAIEDINQLLSTDPNNSQASQLLNQVQEVKSFLVAADQKMENNQFEEASEAYSRVLTLTTHNVETRRKRARAAIAQNQFENAIGDWTRVTQIIPEDQEALKNLALVNYYSMYEPEVALKNVKQFLHYDPDHKKFKALFREIKKFEKTIGKLGVSIKKMAWRDVLSQLNDDGETKGLFTQVDERLKNIIVDIGATSAGPNKLNAKLYSMACLAYSRIKDKKVTIDICTKSLELSPEDKVSLLARAEGYMILELFEKAIEDYNKAYELSEHSDSKIQAKIQNAKKKLKISKQRDYYKILAVSRGAGQKEIKKAFLKMARKWHPDTYRGDLTQDEVEKKMAEINLAYEVLSDEKLKNRYDAGEDPNDPMAGQGGDHFGHGNPFGHGGHPFQFMFQQGGSGGGQHFEFNF